MKKTNKEPKVSVVTVCYNSESTIEYTVKSVLDQNYSHLEYIIIDGGSTDKTVNIIKKYDREVSCIISEKDTGIYNAMNKGLDICTGDYVVFLNSGDCFCNRKVIEIIIKKSNDQDIVYGDLILIHNNGTCSRRQQPQIINKFLFIYHTILHPATFVKRNLFQKYGEFDEQYAVSADFDFFLRVTFTPGISLLYVPLAHFPHPHP